jgi:uncharacterized protein (PEP-CTERM system associated)
MRLTRDSVQTDGDNATTAFNDSKGSTALFSLAGPTTSGDAFGWGLQYTRQNLQTERFGNSTSVNAAANLRYGHDSYEYDSVNNRTAGPSYLAGFAWTPTSRTSIDARFGHSYLGRTGSLMAVQRNRHLVSRVTYTDQVTTSRAQFLLPAAIDTAAMLDRMFSSTIPDPIERAQAVQAYMAATGLPPSLANNINYLSNRYMRDRRLQAAFIYNMPYSSMTLALYRSQRNGLSLQQSDSELLGSQLSSLNDNVRQKGLDASFNYRLSTRTSLNAGASAYRSTSIDTGIVTPGHHLRLGLTRQFDRKMRGILEVRHTSGTGGVLGSTVASGPGSYIENAITATLSVQL